MDKTSASLRPIFGIPYAREGIRGGQTFVTCPAAARRPSRPPARTSSPSSRPNTPSTTSRSMLLPTVWSRSTASGSSQSTKQDLEYHGLFMVALAQSVEHWTVNPAVTGSTPVSHPNPSFREAHRREAEASARS